MRLVALAAVLAFLAVPAAAAKDFAPGDLRLCNAKRCVPIVDGPTVKLLARFYYTGPQAARAPPSASERQPSSSASGTAT